MKRRLMLLAATGCFFVSASVFSALTPGQKMAVDALIKQFSAADFDQRQKAVDRLIEMGLDVAPPVKNALADTADNEVKMRCEMVLKALRDKFGVAAVDGAKEAPPATPAATGDFGPSKITMDMKDTQLDDILAKFAELSGNQKVHVPEKWDGEAVTFAVKDLTYWQALDKLCETVGRVYYSYDYSRTTGQCNGLALWKSAKGREIGEAVGPVSVKLMHGTRTRCLRGQEDTAGMMWGVQGLPVSGNILEYSLSYYWEDRLPVLAREGRITKMVGSDGKELKVLDRNQGMGEFMREKDTRPFFSNFTGVAVDVPDGLDSIKEMDGVVTLTLGRGEKAITVNDVLNAAGKSVTEGDTTITVVKVNAQPGSLSLIVKLKKGDKETEAPVYSYADHYGFQLVGEDGAKLRGMPGRGGIGIYGGFGFTAGPGSIAKIEGAEKPGPNETSVGFFTGRGRGAKAANEKIEGNWTLVYTCPAECVSKEYPFSLKDVPLP